MQQIKRGSKGELIELVQRMLNEKGYSCGSADGIFGTKTERAVRSYQKAKGLSATGSWGTTRTQAVYRLPIEAREPGRTGKSVANKAE